jgi:nucleoside-diphosphate-sugar epimerase
MRIFLAGATGAIGRPLVPALVAAGHDVVGTTRTAAKTGALRAAGAEPVVLDPLDRDAVVTAVAAAKPDVVIHELSALRGLTGFRRFDQDLAATNRLRTDGVDFLLGAALAAGARRFLAQSYTGWPNTRTGGPVKTEDDPLDPAPPSQMRTTLDAIRHVESAVTAAGGVVLRYGGFYGPGTGLAPGGEQWDTVLARKFPVVGDGGGVWSFVHIDDAAGATVTALERWTPGEIYNVVDDEPAAVADWLPVAARAVEAPAPRRVPRWLGRLFAGEPVTVMMTEARGASNAKAKRELAWAPRHASWREGFATGLG